MHVHKQNLILCYCNNSLKSSHEALTICSYIISVPVYISDMLNQYTLFCENNSQHVAKTLL